MTQMLAHVTTQEAPAGLLLFLLGAVTGLAAAWAWRYFAAR